MDPLAALRAAVADGSLNVSRTGLTVLTSGAVAVVVVVLLASPVSRGLADLPGFEQQEAVPPAVRSDPTPKRAVRPDLTPRQKAVARVRAVTAASQEVGVREWGGATNTGRRIIQYRRAVTGPGENPRSREPWCADFVSWAWASAGVPIGFGSRGSDYVPELVLWARLTGRWHAAADKDYRPQRGDLVVYRVGEDRKGHVGLLAQRRGTLLRTIEGNYKDKVSRRVVRMSSPNVTGYIEVV